MIRTKGAVFNPLRMESVTVKSKIALCVLGVCMGCFPLAAMADTLTLKSASGGSVDGIEIYPYNFSVDGSTTLTNLLCLDFNREITFGETWHVTENSIALDNSQTSIDYRALALIDYALSTGYGGYSSSDLQFADWSIFDPTGVAGYSGYTTGAKDLASLALTTAADDSLTNSGFYSNFTLYSPTGDTSGWTDGIPQEFIGDTAPSPAPEPSTLILLGTGLVAISGAVRRKLATA